ncbi:hypothetical protein AB8S16_20620 [Klebsiella pneumoniae]
MKYTAIFLLMLGFCARADMVQNTKMIDLYEQQKPQTRVLMSELNEVMKIIDPVFGLYKHMGGPSPEVVAVSRHLLQIQERSDELYGKAPGATPFSSCRALTEVAYNYWIEKLNSVKTQDEKQLDVVFNQYNKMVKECSKQIKTPPPKMVEELGIIDVTQ